MDRLGSERFGMERFGTLKRAKALLTQLFVTNVLGDDVREREAIAAPRIAPLRASVPERSELLEDPRFVGVGASKQGEGVLLSWRTTDDALASARTIAHGARSLRIVMVRAASDGDVAIDTLDLGEVSAEGMRLLPDVPGLLRAVASIGLFDGDRFVSIAHGSVA
jgi:hypothetical protein